ncbi:hypothetical protein B0O99DRAFT_683428 [Bisporella sp. PMI_857]|nr:hypothetical protein B0O99DRAFT_683428 [Bisporella sp. PMI_857]
MTGLKIPSTITLQRASEEDEQLGIESPFSVFLSDHSPAKGFSMPKIQIAQAQNDRRHSGCVITAHETDSTTETIKSSFKNLSISHPSAKYLSHNSIEISSFYNSRVVTFTAKGFLPTTSTVADSVATAVEAYRFSNKLSNIHDEFQFPPKPKEEHVENENLPRKRTEETIWTAGASDTYEDSEYFRLELSSTDQSPPSAKPPSLPRINNAVNSQVNQESDTSESINALTSINKWSWGVSSTAVSEPSDIQTLEKPQLQDVMITPPPYQYRPRPSVRRVRSDSNESHRQRAFPQLKPRTSDSLIEPGPLINDVVSFPPLPRKLTCDWISPLPDIRADSIHEKYLACERGSGGARRKSLYLEGIDTTVVTTMSSTSRRDSLLTSQSSPKVCAGLCSSCCGYGIDPIALFNLEHSDSHRNCRSTLGLKAPPLSPKVVLDPQYGMKWNKSIVIAHPNAPARTGSSSTIGSSLGASSHVRRKSVHVFGDKFKTCSTWGNVNGDFAYLHPPSSSSFAGSGTPPGPGQTDGDNNNWQKWRTCY